MGMFNWLNNISLKYKFAGLLLFFGVIPAAGLYALFLYLQPAFEEQARKPVKDAAMTLANLVDRNLFERYGDVQAFGF